MLPLFASTIDVVIPLVGGILILILARPMAAHGGPEGLEDRVWKYRVGGALLLVVAGIYALTFFSSRP